MAGGPTLVFALGSALVLLCGCEAAGTATGTTPSTGTDSTTAHAPTHTVDELLGRFDPAAHPDFSRIPDAWTDKDSIYLRTEVLDAYSRMRASADSAGIPLLIRSATRNFEYQRGIWERKWDRPRYMGWSAFEKARDIMTYSSMPGTSRHHWGTDIDLCEFENEWFETGEGAQVYAWLTAHAARFGFHQVYNELGSIGGSSGGRTGYNLERWHWSYMPLSSVMLADYNATVTCDSIQIFPGHQVADSLDVIRRYVNGIDRP